MRSIRSFAKARSRLSGNHKKILKQENDFLFSANTKSAFEKTLRSTNNKILEIGFGEGDSLFEMAVNNPELNFFGIEKVDIISADQMALDYEKSIKEAEAQIENLFKD